MAHGKTNSFLLLFQEAELEEVGHEYLTEVRDIIWISYLIAELALPWMGRGQVASSALDGCTLLSLITSSPLLGGGQTEAPISPSNHISNLNSC